MKKASELQAHPLFQAHKDSIFKQAYQLAIGAPTQPRAKAPAKVEASRLTKVTFKVYYITDVSERERDNSSIVRAGGLHRGVDAWPRQLGRQI